MTGGSGCFCIGDGGGGGCSVNAANLGASWITGMNGGGFDVEMMMAGDGCGAVCTVDACCWFTVDIPAADAADGTGIGDGVSGIQLIVGVADTCIADGDTLTTGVDTNGSDFTDLLISGGGVTP